MTVRVRSESKTTFDCGRTGVSEDLLGMHGKQVEDARSTTNRAFVSLSPLPHFSPFPTWPATPVAQACATLCTICPGGRPRASYGLPKRDAWAS